MPAHNKINQDIFKWAFLLISFSPVFLGAQDISSLESKILGHWVVYKDFGADSVLYVPFNSDLSADIIQYEKYGGITFEKGNVCLHHRWKKCGNDSGTDHYKGEWMLQKINDSYLLGINKEAGEIKKYILLQVTSNKLVLAPAP